MIFLNVYVYLIIFFRIGKIPNIFLNVKMSYKTFPPEK